MFPLECEKLHTKTEKIDNGHKNPVISQTTYELFTRNGLLLDCSCKT